MDLRALAVGRREDGQVWVVRVHGTHVLIAGATGAGKASLLWSIVRALLPAMVAGLVRVWAADPKLMELAYGRAIFDRYGRYAATPDAIATMLKDAVAGMQRRAAVFAGKHRQHTPTPEHPFIVILVDEVAFLTAYLSDRALRDKIKAALATLTTQGRAVGYSVVAALQDPRKEVMNIRNLFPDRIAMRLDEAEQVDMVLGDGAHTHGHGPSGLGELVVLALGVVLAAGILARVLTLLLAVLAVGGGVLVAGLVGYVVAGCRRYQQRDTWLNALRRGWPDVPDDPPRAVLDDPVPLRQASTELRAQLWAATAVCLLLISVSICTCTASLPSRSPTS